MVNDQEIQALEDRVVKFLCLQLEGQPYSMHMGTFYLVDDLLTAVKKYAELAKNVPSIHP